MKFLPTIEQLIAILLLAAGLFAVRKFLQFSVVLYGRRVERLLETNQKILEYKFAIHNAENVELKTKGHLLITIEILSRYGRFTDAPLKICAGPIAPEIRRDELRKKEVVFLELAEYDTWIVECKTNEMAKKVRFKLQEEVDRRSFFWRFTNKFSVSQITLTPDKDIEFSGAESKPSSRTVIAWILAACGFYLTPVAFHSSEWFPLREYFSQFNLVLDGALLSILIVFGSTLFWISRRGVTPVVQGYRENSLPEK